MNSKAVLVIVVVVILGAIFYLERLKPDSRPFSGEDTINNRAVTMSFDEKAKKYDTAKEIVNPSGFLNVEPGFNLQNVIGKKVILADFWTYSCINCQRTLPYLNAWYEKYKDQGLEIVGIHTPEFEFEKKYENVRQAIEKYGIKYPVVQDNDYSTWQAYGNRYWPRKYLIDIDGFIVYDHIGEGGYEETEKKIQELLQERKTAFNESFEVGSDVVNPEDAESVIAGQARTPEIYFGFTRNELLGNGLRGKAGEQNFSAPKTLIKNQFYLQGPWDIREEYAENKTGSAEIILSYKAQKVFMVASSESGVRVRILLDGKEIGDDSGRDVGADGTLVINEEGLYRLVESGEYGSHELTIIIEAPGLEAFTFTFG